MAESKKEKGIKARLVFVQIAPSAADQPSVIYTTQMHAKLRAERMRTGIGYKAILWAMQPEPPEGLSESVVSKLLAEKSNRHSVRADHWAALMTAYAAQADAVGKRRKTPPLYPHRLKEGLASGAVVPLTPDIMQKLGEEWRRTGMAASRMMSLLEREERKQALISPVNLEGLDASSIGNLVHGALKHFNVAHLRLILKVLETEPSAADVGRALVFGTRRLNQLHVLQTRSKATVEQLEGALPRPIPAGLTRENLERFMKLNPGPYVYERAWRAVVAAYKSLPLARREATSPGLIDFTAEKRLDLKKKMKAAGIETAGALIEMLGTPLPRGMTEEEIIGLCDGSATRVNRLHAREIAAALTRREKGPRKRKSVHFDRKKKEGPVIG